MKQLFFVLFVIALPLSGCNGDSHISPENKEKNRQYKVDMTINLQPLTENLHILVDNENGLAGVQLYCSERKVLNAYDLACPIEWSSEHKLIDNEMGELRCLECESSFNTETGKPISGKAYDNNISLVQYTITGSKTFKITNP